MTNQEAIETIKTAIAEVEWNYSLEYAVAFEKAIEALEKQVPKKPNYENVRNRYCWAICPSCFGSVFKGHIIEHLHNNENTYCEHCGQALDWSE